MMNGGFTAISSKRSHISQLLLASALSGFVAFAATPAFAQDASTPETAAPAGSAPAAATSGNDEEIVVTGSRLIRRDLVATSPITTVTADLVQDSGRVTLEDTLNNFPQLAPDSTSTTNQSGGSGVLSVDLRSLGAVRTLVLVDGRRYIPADVTGLVDLATIPDLLVDRVEIITGGASAVYGSDAVAGAVNFVLKRNFEGAEAKYQYGESDRGDGVSHKADFLMGVNSGDGRGNLTAYASYTKRDAIFAGDRSFSANPVLPDANGVFQPFGSGNIPGGLISINASQIPRFTGVPDLNNASGRCNTTNAGIRFGTSGQPLAFCRLLDQYNYAAPNFLLRPFQRYQATLSGHYELLDHVEAYGQFFYTRKENAYQQAPEAVSPSSSGQSAGTILIPNADTNPVFTPALRTFFAQNRSIFDADGDGVFTVTGVGRRFTEFGPRTVDFTAESFGFTGGFRGDFELGDNAWRYDSFYQYQQSSVTGTRFNLLSRSRLTAALDVVTVNGVAQCRNREIPNCIPVNIFGDGILTPAQANFLSVNSTTRDQFKRTVAGGSVSGELFELPAGKVSTAFGVEYRKDSFSTVPDETALNNDLAAFTVAPIINGGSLNVFEVFGETRIPILQDLPFVKSLALEGAVRYADYSTIGGVVTWKGAVDWEATEWLRLRGNYSRAIRAPNLNELYAPVTSGFTGGTDPCIAANRPTAAQKTFCVQQGVPQAFIDTLAAGASQGYNVVSGGNRNLNEESADTLTLGVVIQPPMIPRMSLTVDYYDIKLEDAITQIAAQTLVNNCFATLDASTAACQSIRRNAQGNIDTVTAPLLNIAQRKVRGLDVAVNYSTPLPSWLELSSEGSSLSAQLVGSFQFRDREVQIPGATAIECAGYYSGPCSSDSVRITPDFRAFLNLTYKSGPFTLRNDFRYIDNLKLSPLSGPNQAGTVPAETYWDLYGSFEFLKHVEVFAGVNNVLDNQPTIIGYTAGGDENVAVQLYDVIGRTYFAGVKFKF